MKTTLLTSAAVLVFGVSTSLAAIPALDVSALFAPSSQADMIQLASNGSDDSGSDDHGGNGGHHISGHDDSDNDDHGSDDSDDDASSSNSNDDSHSSKSKRRKARVRGGSGCDSAGDAAEHAGCQ